MAQTAIERFLKLPFNTVLDVGCGQGAHSNVFRNFGKNVTPIDIGTSYPGAIVDDYNKHAFLHEFDAVWVSHVLEHQENVGLFLKKIFLDLKDHGYLCITVPPMKPNIVGGHLTVWNAGLLIYNLVMSGFDCSQAKIKKYGYNISVIVQKKGFNRPNLKYDCGDIEMLAPFMPVGMKKQSFNGEVEELNWEDK